MTGAVLPLPTQPTGTGKKRLLYRHSLIVRVTHWINVVSMAALFMSGLQISNATPSLFWGMDSDFDNPLLNLPNFPDWAILPHGQWLALGRRWHFFMAWIFVANAVIYMANALLARHLKADLLPSRADLRNLWRTFIEHLRFRFHEQGLHYNPIQKLTYLIVLFGLGPLILITGLSMSPRIDASLPWLPELFGGRQSARTVHFLCAFSFFGFFLIHIVMVIVSGLWNNIRSMVTGRYAVSEEGSRK